MSAEDRTPTAEQQPRPGWRRAAAVLATGAAALVVAGCAAVAAWCVTWRTRAWVAGVGATVACLALAVDGWLLRSCLLRRCRAMFLVAAATGLVLALHLPPERKGGGGEAIVEHVFLDPGSAAPPGLLSSFVSEADQIALGIRLAQGVDARVDAEKAERIRRLTLPIYLAMERDPAFAHMGSALGYGYREFWGGPPDPGHYVAIVPAYEGDGRGPTLAFLHGSGGNFASYWYVLAPLARERGIAIVCPTFGLGNWHKKGGVEAALRATDHAVERYGLDPKRVYLAALSNGGRGATRIIAQHAGRFRGVALISAVLEHGPIRAGLADGAWRGLPVLFIHGSLDLRLPIGPTRDRVAELRTGGARVTEMVMDGEDHFLLFAQRRAVVDRLGAWIEECERGREGE
jgi:poly(3-hydroxybutyrate) depolymerase